MENNSQITKKKKITGIIIGIVIAGCLAFAAILVIAIIIAILVVGSPNRKLQQQLDLGDKYITELDYDNAIVAYQNALEIDPKSEEAYLKLADAYMMQGDIERAISVLEDGYNILNSEQIKEKLDSLTNKLELEMQGVDNSDIEDDMWENNSDQEMLSSDSAVTEIYDYEEYENIEINNDTFPDEVFRNYVLENFDKEKDGILDKNDILNAQSLWLDESDVYSLDGIEYLWNVMWIYCDNNHLQSVDLSNNVNLLDVRFENNNITDININNNPKLEWIDIEHNQLTEIDVSRDIALKYVYFSYNNLSEIDISCNNNIVSFSCIENENLTTLYLGNNDNINSLACFNCKKLKKIDISGCPQILDYYNNGIFDSDDYFGHTEWRKHEEFDGLWFCCDDVTEIITR